LLSSPFFNKPETINREGRNYGPASLQMTLTNEIHFRTLDLMSNQSNHISLIFITIFSHLDSSQLQPSKKKNIFEEKLHQCFGNFFFFDKSEVGREFKQQLPLKKYCCTAFLPA
jgi:hypothetical protein